MSPDDPSQSVPGHLAGRRITVVGGGIGGLSAALAMARRGAQVTIHERADALREVGAGLQITPNGAAVLATFGIDLSAAGLGAVAVQPMDAMSGRRVARFDLTRLPGHGYWFLHRATLIEILADAARAAGVEIRLGHHVTGPGLLPLADLSIGADGIHSVLRPVLNGAEKAAFSGQVAWRAVVPLGDNAIDQEPVARIWMAPGRHVVTYPLPGGRMNIVAVREQSRWVPEGWHHPDTPSAMQAAFGDCCAELRAILDKVEEVNLWGLFRHPVARVWHNTDIALLGDAAHPTLPFLAQGANLAIEDAAVLAMALGAIPDQATALAAYQARRRYRVVAAIAAANRNAVNYHLSGLHRIAAHGVLRTIDRLAPQAFLRRMDWLYGHDVTRVAFP